MANARIRIRTSDRVIVNRIAHLSNLGTRASSRVHDASHYAPHVRSVPILTAVGRRFATNKIVVGGTRVRALKPSETKLGAMRVASFVTVTATTTKLNYELN